MRLGDERFRVVTGGAHGMADRKWFSDHLPDDGSAQLHDLSSAWCTLGLWGPRARDVLAGVTGDDVSNEGFPFAPAERSRSDHCALASRISYVGDLGWELYVPIEQGARLWDIVWEAGRPHGVVPVGIGVYGTTGRLEKCYRAYGTELETEYDVVEAGMAWGTDKEQDFVGKEAHLRQREQEPAAVLCTLTVDDHTSSAGVKRYMLGREPVLTREGKPLVDAKGRRSYVTSAGAGPSVGKHILMSYVPPERASVGRGAGHRVHGRAVPGHGRDRRVDAALRPETRGSGREHPCLCQACSDYRRADRPDGRRAGDRDAPPRLHDLPARGVRRRGGGAARGGAGRRGGRADPGPARGGGAAAGCDGDRRRPGDPSRHGRSEWDSQATAEAIVDAISGEELDLLLFGNEAADSGDYQVGIRVAHALGLPCVTGVKGVAVQDGRVRLEREVSGGRTSTSCRCRR